MEEGRAPQTVFRNKPRVIFDKRFRFVNFLQVGDKGQMKVKMIIDGIHMRMDEDTNERKIYTLKIEEAELIENKADRL